MLTRKELQNLLEGDDLLYTAGKAENHIVAEVTVTEVGSEKATVRVNRILEKGSKVAIKVGDHIQAGPKQLEHDD